MNRPNELLKELQDFNETSFGLELSNKDCKELFNYIFVLEKALEVAAESDSDENEWHYKRMRCKGNKQEQYNSFLKVAEYELKEEAKQKHLSDFIDDYFGWNEND